jgi:hypothetical protein
MLSAIENQNDSDELEALISSYSKIVKAYSTILKEFVSDLSEETS